eukprot:802152-Pyramimonas_sp.AAC.1
MLARLYWNITGCGLSFATDYSGVDAPREALTQMIAAMQQKMQSNSPNGEFYPKVEGARSCDWGSLQSEVLATAARREGGNSCHFTNILDRMPSWAKEVVEEGSTFEQTDTDEDKAKKLSDVKTFIEQNRKI